MAVVSSLLSGLPSVHAQEVDVVVAGSFPNKALLIIDGGPPRAVRVGTTTAEGVKVLSVDGGAVTFSVGAGPRQTLRAGERLARFESAPSGGELTLPADSSGHFRTRGAVNGARINFLVDTGATLVSLGLSDARRAGVNHTAGQRAMAQTANGMAVIWLVRLDSLEIGGITLRNVEAAIHEQELPFALLGMSALRRMDLRNDGQKLVIRRRY